MIQIKNVSVVVHRGTTHEKTILTDINIKAEIGEFILVIGENGAGKSTLLNAISGEIQPTTGTITIEPKKQWVSKVLQDPNRGTWKELTIEENLALSFGQANLSWEVQKSNYPLFITRLKELGLGLEKRLKTPLKLLSGGQRQAISLVMATIKEPSILLLDEHTSALDPVTANTIMDLTDKLIKEHAITAFMITHNPRIMEHYGHRIITMKNGMIISDQKK